MLGKFPGGSSASLFIVVFHFFTGFLLHALTLNIHVQSREWPSYMPTGKSRDRHQ
jgi:hypothetical protein